MAEMKEECKICIICNINKSLNDFYISRTSKTGKKYRASYCKIRDNKRSAQRFNNTYVSKKTKRKTIMTFLKEWTNTDTKKMTKRQLLNYIELAHEKIEFFNKDNI